MTEGAMDKVRLGRTDLMVTSVCFGTSGLGDMPDTYGYGVDEARARATLHAIFDGPANFIDTARNYGLGRSEERIGAAIRERGGGKVPVAVGFGISNADHVTEIAKFADAAVIGSAIVQRIEQNRGREAAAVSEFLSSLAAPERPAGASA